MLNNFYNDFSEKVKSPHLQGCVNKYYACQRNFKCFVFVEGKTDELFYSYFLSRYIKNYFPGDIKYLACGNKENIGHLINFLISKHRKLSSNQYFIADKDFNELSTIECRQKDKISLTKYYSLESYAFLEQNLNLILDYCGLDEDEKNIFYELFDYAVKKILDYETLIDMRTNNLIDVDILTLGSEYIAIFNDRLIFAAEFLNKIKLATTKVEKSTLSEIYFAKKADLQVNFLNMRGHDLELLFDAFLEYLSKDISLNKILKDSKIVSKMKIELVLK